MSYADFTNLSGISYVDYLQARKFEKSIHYEIQKQTKDIIASNEELAKKKIRAEEKTKESIERGFTRISYDLDLIHKSIHDGFNSINTTLEWGFAEILVSLAILNDTISELVRISKTPSQTWAFEQYNIAQDEFRRGLYPEAFESINRAITGYGTNPGYKSEFRFHFLLGTLRLGSFANNSRDIVDLDQAEVSFLNASRYAQHDNPTKASYALLGAGRAAFANNKLAKARTYFEDSIKLHDAGETRYQLAKTLCALNDLHEAFDHLEKAIVFNKMYAIKAGGEAEFQQVTVQLDAFLSQLRDRTKSTFTNKLKTFEKITSEIRGIKIDRYSMIEYGKDGMALIDSKLTEAKNTASHNTYFGYIDAIDILSSYSDYKAKAIANFKSSALADIEALVHK